MRRGLWLLALVFAPAGCGDDSTAPPDGPLFAPTEPRLLSTASPTKDEDPSVLRAADGTLYVAWFSDRGGNNDVYLTRSADGENWLAPIRITTHPGGDFYPNLLQDNAGMFHLVWFRWTVLFVGTIVYNSSADGITWSEAAEEAVTTDAGVDDWVPTIVRANDGALLVYFVSDTRDGANPTNEIYVVRKPAAAAAWSAPAAASVNSPTLHDHLPFAANVDGEITLVWTRSAAATPWESADADVYFAVSPDGLAWSGATAVAHDAGDVVHVFPSLTRAFDGDWSLVWLSTRSGGARAFELPRAAFGAYPAAAVALDLPEGYSHRVAPTSTEGVYFAAWVQGPDGAQDVWYRFFAK